MHLKGCSQSLLGVRDLTFINRAIAFIKGREVISASFVLLFKIDVPFAQDVQVNRILVVP